MPITVYLAAALFSARETAWNAQLAGALEARGHRVWLPQRDGFEFAELQRHLAPLLPAAEIPGLLRQLIYHLDLGIFLAESDAVVAVMDEPLDEGVIVELCYARAAGIPVLGLRSDARSPFGAGDDGCGGCHFFPWFQCQAWLTLPTLVSDPAALLAELGARIDGWLRALPPRPAGPLPWQELVERARELLPEGPREALPRLAARLVERAARLPQPVVL